MADSNIKIERKKKLNYEAELEILHKELVHFQEWVKNEGFKSSYCF